MILFTATQAQAQETESTSLLGLLQQGGWAMFPLGLTASFMFFLIFYCWRETRPTRFASAELTNALSASLKSREVGQAMLNAPAQRRARAMFKERISYADSICRI